MFRLKERLYRQNAVKESFDNLPCGVCYFSRNGVNILCNHQMVRLIHLITGRDPQSLSEMLDLLNGKGLTEGVIREDSCFYLPDQTVWRFYKNEIINKERNSYTEVTAVEVTELKNKQELLEETNRAKKQTIAALEQIQQNVVAITREEEILAMKMKLHNEFGYNLQDIRRYFKQGCQKEEKREFIQRQYAMIQKMKNEMGQEDQIDPLDDLTRLAENLNMKIKLTGRYPQMQYPRMLLAFAIRACLTNTIRHAQGDTLYVSVTYETNMLTASLTNNGKQPDKEIVEGGGLTSLRTKIEQAGGIMIVHGIPRFSLMITIPLEGDDEI